MLRRGGHVRVVAGSNGAACPVARDHLESLYPICYDSVERSLTPDGPGTQLVIDRDHDETRLLGATALVVAPAFAAPKIA